jgi:hypothetical protein
MSKRGASALAIFFLFIILSFSVLAQSNATESNQTTSKNKIDAGYQCLVGKVENKCSSLTLEEQIFSLLALSHDRDIKEECAESIIASSSNDGECWPSNNCNIKTTAQAILALSEAGEDTSKAEDWLLSRNSTSSDLTWFLEIDSNSATSCTIEYEGQSYSISIGEDKKISSDAGTCLSRSSGNYWLRVSPNCYEDNFKISCNQGFLTTLLYQKQGSSQIYVSSDVMSASAEGSVEEKITALCFSSSGSQCDYEGSLWAAYVLDKDYDISSFRPYITALSEENEQFLPEAFIYALTGNTDSYNILIGKQLFNQYWDVSGEKLYDTPLALLLLGSVGSKEAANAREYLLDVQDSNGCWKNNIRDTSFILYSGWPKFSSTGVPPVLDREPCVDQGFYCMFAFDCLDAAGDDLSDNYQCVGSQVCCSKPPIKGTCADEGGVKCSLDEQCVNGNDISGLVSDVSSGEICCSGTCQEFVANECAQNVGICKTFCDNDEDESFYSCPISSDTCCLKSAAPVDEGGPNIWIIILLVILIILVIIAILFRDRIRSYYYKYKSRKTVTRTGPGPSSNVPGGRPPGYPPRLPPGYPSRPIPRRILPQSSRIQPSRPSNNKTDKELDETLNKLKNMGKK